MHWGRGQVTDLWAAWGSWPTSLTTFCCYPVWQHSSPELLSRPRVCSCSSEFGWGLLADPRQAPRPGGVNAACLKPPPPLVIVRAHLARREVDRGAFADEGSPGPVAIGVSGRGFADEHAQRISKSRTAIFHEPEPWQVPPVLCAAGWLRRSILTPHGLASGALEVHSVISTSAQMRRIGHRSVLSPRAASGHPLKRSATAGVTIRLHP
jgi:hypothetical protein